MKDCCNVIRDNPLFYAQVKPSGDDDLLIGTEMLKIIQLTVEHHKWKMVVD